MLSAPLFSRTRRCCRAPRMASASFGEFAAEWPATGYLVASFGKELSRRPGHEHYR